MAGLMTEQEKAAGLDAAVNAAADQLVGETEKETPEETEETEETGEAEDDSPEETPVSDEQQAPDELDEAQTDEAKRLYKALRDPKVSNQLLAALAHEAGLTVIGKGSAAPPTAAEEKKIVKSIKETLAESLGKEYDFLVPKLAPVLEQIVENQNQQAAATQHQLQVEKVQREVVEATEALSKETKGDSKKFEARMVQLAEELPIGPKTQIRTYLKQLYTLAAAEKGKAPQSTRNVDQRVRTNANNAAERVQGTTGRTSQTRSVADGNKKLNLNEAVRAAYDELSSGRKR